MLHAYLIFLATIGLGVPVGFGVYRLVIWAFSAASANRVEPPQPRLTSGEVKALAALVGIAAGVGCATFLWVVVVPILKP